jgi:hypothetical protein
MPKSRINFNVGGTKYEVSDSLLDRYPDSMLRKISSDTWQEGATDKSTEEIFIDRNGERFQYVLDYLRDSCVELPMSIPKGQLVADLDYFGIDYGDGSTITLSVSNPKDLFHSLGQYRDYFDTQSAEIGARYSSVAIEVLACDIAKEYFSRLVHIPAAKTAPAHTYSSASVPTDAKVSVQFFCATPIIVKKPQGHNVPLFSPAVLNRHLNLVGLTCQRIVGTPYDPAKRSHYVSSPHDAVEAYIALM